MIRRPAAVALAALAVSLPAFAQTKPTPGSLPAFDEVTKDMEAVPGLMTFYRYKSNDVTKDQTRILCAVPKSLLKQDLLFAVNFSRGNQAGFQYQDGLVRWEQVGRQLTLVTPDTRFIDKPGSPINEALRRTYRPSFLFSAPIVTLTPGGDPVVDLSDALFSPPVPVPGGRVRRDISRVDTVKSFPENTLIDIDYALATGQGGSTVGLSYAFRRLPSASEGYKPRVADERVGYFQTTRQDWTIKYDQREFVDRYANRWDLRKKDPSLDLSPPEKPITFVIDKGVPYQWRKYVADGLLEWNKAFEKVGIVGAIVVQQQTDDNEFADADPADARYNFIQWTVRNQALAVGPSRADPRTGQILDADIVIDDAWIRYYNNNTATFTPKPSTAMLGPGTVDFLRKHPQFLPPGVTADDLKPAPGELMNDSGTPDVDGQAKSPLRRSIGGDQCQLAVGMVAQLSLAGGVAAEAKAAGAPPKVSDEIIGQALKWVVMHEVGHTLGLRHNFKASSWLSLEEIRKKRDAGESFVASVMDYAPLSFFPDDDLTKVKTFASDTIGPYDYWAINYGYTQPKDGEPLAKTLKDITSQSAKREYAYATDEDTMGLVSPDPLVNRYDLSDDPIAFAKNQIALTDKLLANVQDWAVKPDEPNYYLRQTFLQLAGERSRNLQFVSRLIGGQYFTRSRRADPGAPPR
ncbi:MAG: zinc-dependent metalloprotease [Tepidisphaeraceae bacterium]